MLNAEQLSALRMAPLNGPNKVSLAMELVGLTQAELGEAIGTTQGTVSRVTRGGFPKLPIETARKFAEFFGCSMEDLFPRANDRDAAEVA